MVEAAEKNLKNNPEVDYPGIRDRVEKLHAHYVDLKRAMNMRWFMIWKNHPLFQWKA